jgi:hypothetical protein
MSSINIREELNRFRDRLLDLSNANRLLNYRKTKTRSVQIVHARLDHIMQRLDTEPPSRRTTPATGDSGPDARPHEGRCVANRTRLKECARTSRLLRFDSVCHGSACLNIETFNVKPSPIT